MRYSTEYECKTLTNFAEKAKEGIVEIGVLDGETTREISKKATVPIYGIDPIIPDSMNAGLVGNEQIIKDNMKHYDKFVFIKDYSYNVIKTWKYPIDMVFIDGDHNYDAVKKDMNDWWNILPSDGIMLVHDSAPVLSENSTFKGHDGVIRAVKEFNMTNISNIAIYDTITGFRKL